MATTKNVLALKSSSGDVLESVLDGAMEFVRRYVILPPPAAVALTGWVAHAHAVEQADVSPYLAITSPELRSGKTRLLEVLELLVPRPWRVTIPSAPTLFRKIHASSPTLLLDEADAIWGSKGGTSHEALRAVLNSGNRRGATVPRVESFNGVRMVVEYSVFCPKALAGIGRLPATVADRSIHIRLNRRLPTEKVQPFRLQAAQADAEPIRKALADLGKIDTSMIRVSIPETLNDRAAEAWEPLLTIAETAGGPWPKLMRHAAVVLSTHAAQDVETLGLILLRDLKTIFDEKEVDRLPTADIMAALRAMDESPWSVKRIEPYMLASLLRPHNVMPQNLRKGANVIKGYKRKDLEPVWDRWVG
jgi:hypothetical protein